MVEGSKNKMRRTKENQLTKGEKSFILEPGAGLKVALKYWSPLPPIGGPPTDMSSIPAHIQTNNNFSIFLSQILMNSFSEHTSTTIQNLVTVLKVISQSPTYISISKHNNFLTSINTAMQYHQVFWMSLASVDGINKHNHDINIHLQNLTKVILSISGLKLISQDTSLILGSLKMRLLVLMLLVLTLLNF